MIDYGALRKKIVHQTPIDPVDLFKRLPKSENIKDLFDIQRKALQEWFQRRNDKDVVIKLNTGGGKTLVGLLIAQSIMSEHHGPVLYLCPNRQLASQILDKACELGIPAHLYERRVDAPEFLNGQSVMVAPYHALFNGQSKFGLQGRQTIALQGIIVDDAHAALPIMRKQFTLTIETAKQKETYDELIGLFRHDFSATRKDAILDDIVQDKDRGVLEVPYWGWKAKIDAVRQIITSAADRLGEQWKEYDFTWPLLRDELDICHVLISSRDFSITPMYPIVELIPSFADCPRRIYMSATLSDDSAIIRTFNSSPEFVSNPIMPVEITNVGERMILVPSFTKIEPDEQLELVKRLAVYVSKKTRGGKGYGVVVLVPSRPAAQEWTDIGMTAEGDEVAKCVEKLQRGKSRGPYIFANR